MVGADEWPENPALTVPEPVFAFVRLWGACRGGMGGIAHWPDDGGVAHQAAWVVDAFAMLAGIDAKLEAEIKARTGG